MSISRFFPNFNRPKIFISRFKFYFKWQVYLFIFVVSPQKPKKPPPPSKTPGIISLTYHFTSEMSLISSLSSNIFHLFLPASKKLLLLATGSWHDLMALYSGTWREHANMSASVCEWIIAGAIWAASPVVFREACWCMLRRLEVMPAKLAYSIIALNTEPMSAHASVVAYSMIWTLLS